MTSMVMLEQVVRGEVVRADVVFRDADGEPADPTIVTFQVRVPGGQVRTYRFGQDAAVSRLALGTYRLELRVDVPGRWHLYARADGAVETAAIGRIDVAHDPLYDATS